MRRATGSRPGVPTGRASDGQGRPAAGGELRFDDALLRRLEKLSLRANRVTGAAGGRPGTLRLPAADFIDHRPYSPGDDQRHIDWPAAARHDALFVKVGRASQAADVHVLLDVSRSMGFDQSKWRLARELTAALGWISLAQGDRVTLTCFSSGPPGESWGPASGGGKGAGLITFLSSLLSVSEGRSELGHAVQEVTRNRAAGGLLVLVSDLWFADDLEEALGHAPSPRWEVLVLQVLAREELSPSVTGSLELLDAETGERLTIVVDDEVRSEYRYLLNSRLERVRRVTSRKGASYALIPGDWRLERAVIPYLQRLSVLTS